MKILLRLALISAAFLALATGAQAAKGSCKPATVKYRTSLTPATTTSASFQAVSGTRIAFRQRGSDPTCVVVQFSAMVGAEPGDLMFLEAVLDGVEVAQPGLVQMVLDEPVALQRTANFVFPSVAPGKHVVKIYFKSNLGSGVSIYSRTTTLQHK